MRAGSGGFCGRRWKGRGLPSVTPRFLHEGVEKPLLGWVVRSRELRMPLHSDEPSVTAEFHRLDRSIGGVGGDIEIRRDME